MVCGLVVYALLQRPAHPKECVVNETAPVASVVPILLAVTPAVVVQCTWFANLTVASAFPRMLIAIQDGVLSQQVPF